MLELKDGKRIYVESWAGYKWSYLMPLTDWETEYFGDSVNYRIPSGSKTDIAYAVKVEVTGRTHQLKHNNIMVKGKITWYREDDQPVETSPCWLAVYDDLAPADRY